MPAIDPTTIAPDRLATMLAAWAAGYYLDEAAVGLLTHGCGGLWLRRRDFLAACVEATDDGWTCPGPDDPDGPGPVSMAAVRWEDVPAFLGRGVPASSGEVSILRAAASIAGAQVGSLREITMSLDADNLAAVLDAVAHRAGWHEHALTHTVTGTWQTRSTGTWQTRSTGTDRRPACAFADPGQLPTFEQIRTEAYRLLGDAADWLRSDRRPGTGPSAAAAEAVADARAAIATAKAALNRAACTRTEAGR